MYQEMDDVDREIRKVTGEDEEEGEEVPTPTPRSQRSQGQDLIHPNEVLKALRQFVEDNKQQTK